MTELKPCPFCGGEAVLREKYVPIGAPYIDVLCGDCGVEMPGYFDNSSAIKAWNTRVGDDE